MDRSDVLINNLFTALQVGVIFAALLAIARAGYLHAPAAIHAAPVAAYAAPAQVAHYSSAPAVSSSYIHQAHSGVHAAPVAAVHAAPVAAVHAAPVAAIHAAPVVHHAAPYVHHAAVHAAPVAVHAPAVGASEQSVVRSYGGNHAVSHYAKAVDSAFSSVRKYDTRITNDALAVAPVAHYAHAAPVAHYAHAAPLAHYAHAAPVAHYAHAAPVAAYAAHAAPVAAYAAHAPLVAKTAAVAYSPAAVVSHATFSGHGAHYAW
ncbi:hypothetical protein FQA39_LY05258 [Lamprigera yunnana]|nr:hypothetical protein FQA39_LY05258 [Lamprigera yunnana]